MEFRFKKKSGVTKDDTPLKEPLRFSRRRKSKSREPRPDVLPGFFPLVFPA